MSAEENQVVEGDSKEWMEDDAGDEGEEGAGEEGDKGWSKDKRKEFVSKLLHDPQMMVNLQSSLRRFLGKSSEYISSLPPPMKRRIKALKKLQLEYTELEAQFYKEVHELEVKYDKMHQSLYDKRRAIVGAEHEPTEEEADYPSDKEDDDEDDELAKELKEKAKLESDVKVHEFDDTTKGLPEFWLTIFKNVDLLAEMVQEYDEPILKHLTDVQLKFHDAPMGFTLDFHFSENEYFTNKLLTKYYEMKCQPDKDDPFSFEGPEIFKCKGCNVDWKKGKNVTIKTIKKKQKHKSRGAVRTITKTVQNDSFFNFFSPPPVPEDPSEDMDEDTQALLTADFEIGHYIRERIVPRAVLFFTGEALDDDDFEEEEEEGDEDEDEEGEEEEEDDPDYDPSKDPKAGQQQQECKQQ